MWFSNQHFYSFERNQNVKDFTLLLGVSGERAPLLPLFQKGLLCLVALCIFLTTCHGACSRYPFEAHIRNGIVGKAIIEVGKSFICV